LIAASSGFMTDNRKAELRAWVTDQGLTPTQWTVVLVAKESTSPGAATALENLCRTYWEAVYEYARRRGYSSADAAGLTQAFFARFLGKHLLREVEGTKGEFRSFVLKTFNGFLTDPCRPADPQTPGGTYQMIPIRSDG